MKKVLIFYASYGGGHLNAAKSINDYIISNYPNNDVELIDCMKYVNKTIEKLTTAAYREMEDAGDALDIEKAKIFREKFNNRVNDNPESVVKEISKADKERIIDMVQRKETINETLSSDDLDNIEAIKIIILFITLVQ